MFYSFEPANKKYHQSKIRNHKKQSDWFLVSLKILLYIFSAEQGKQSEQYNRKTIRSESALFALECEAGK